MPPVSWCSGMRRAIQDNNQSTDGPQTSPYVIRLFSRSFQKISHLLLIIPSTAQCIRVRGIGTDSPSCMTHCICSLADAWEKWVPAAEQRKKDVPNLYWLWFKWPCGGTCETEFVIQIFVKYCGEFQTGRDSLLSHNPDNLGQIPHYRLGLSIQLKIQLAVIKC